MRAFDLTLLCSCYASILILRTLYYYYCLLEIPQQQHIVQTGLSVQAKNQTQPQICYAPVKHTHEVSHGEITSYIGPLATLIEVKHLFF